MRKGYRRGCTLLQARFVSPFVLQPARSQSHNDEAEVSWTGGGGPRLIPKQPLIKPAAHTQMVHRLSSEFQSDLPSMLSGPDGSRRPELADQGVSNTQEVSFSSGSNVTASQAQGRKVKKTDSSAWDELVRYRSLDPEPTASQLSVTRTQQAMTLMGRTESIRDRSAGN